MDIANPAWKKLSERLQSKKLFSKLPPGFTMAEFLNCYVQFVMILLMWSHLALWAQAHYLSLEHKTGFLSHRFQTILKIFQLWHQIHMVNDHNFNKWKKGISFYKYIIPAPTKQIQTFCENLLNLPLAFCLIRFMEHFKENFKEINMCYITD